MPVAEAVAQAILAVGGVELDVVMCHYAAIDEHMKAMIQASL